MTKQEEIREGIRYFVADGCAYYKEKECPFENNLACVECNERIDELLGYLYSQGVVIKGDSESISCKVCPVALVCGYEVVEPLIEEVKGCQLEKR